MFTATVLATTAGVRPELLTKVAAAAPLINAKMAELTPMANASVSTAIPVNPGAFNSCRNANLKSCIMEVSSAAFPV